jgi:phage portal protein BeeE
MHPTPTKVVATKQGEVAGCVMLDPSNGETTRFEPEGVLHFRLPSSGNHLSGKSPLELGPVRKPSAPDDVL